MESGSRNRTSFTDIRLRLKKVRQEVPTHWLLTGQAGIWVELALVDRPNARRELGRPMVRKLFLVRDSACKDQIWATHCHIHGTKVSNGKVNSLRPCTSPELRYVHLIELIPYRFPDFELLYLKEPLSTITPSTTSADSSAIRGRLGG